MALTSRGKWPRRWTAGLSWAALIAIAALLGLYAKPDAPIVPPGAGRLFPRVPAPAADLPTLLWRFGVGSLIWYAAAVTAPFLVWAARRVDPERMGWTATIAVTSGLAVVMGIATAAMEYGLTYRGAPMAPGLLDYLQASFGNHLLPWVALMGVVAAAEGRRRVRQSSLDRERLRAEVAEQRLIALTGQLQPHFLFNTLQGISTLIYRDPRAADEMLTKLADLLRELLRHRDRVNISLEDELRYIRIHLEIAHLRFPDRLEVTIDVPEEIRQASVPLFLLQPLVENALRHGIGRRMEGGRVTVSAARDRDRLVLQVTDDGPGLANGASQRQGLGLTSVRERLRAAFGADHSFALGPGERGGVVARIEIPYQTHSSA